MAMAAAVMMGRPLVTIGGHLVGVSESMTSDNFINACFMG